MVSFELGKEVEKSIFCLIMSVGRASECGIRRSEVWFLMGTQNFFLCPTLVIRQKYLFYFFTKLKTYHLSYYFTKMVLLTSLILAVCRTYIIIIWTLWWALLITSVWLSYRVLEHRIRRSDVLFLMGTQNFFLCSTLLTRQKVSFSFLSSCNAEVPSPLVM